MTATASQITLVTTCMQRLNFLQRSLPTWLEHTDFPVIVVDYSCPENTGEWVAAQDYGERVRVVRHAGETSADGRVLFNPARARNAGGFAASGDYLLFVDSDMLAREGFQEQVEACLEREVMLAVVDRFSSLFGLLGVHREAFEKAGGYDEGFVGWGGEDIDLRIRLHLAGLRCVPLPQDRIQGMPHSNALRARNSASRNFRVASKLNEDYLERKLLETTGRSFMEWVEDPAVDFLVHAAGEAPPSGRLNYR